MTTITHAVSAALIAVTAGGVPATETRYLVAALTAGAVADLDHLVPVVRRWAYFREHGFRGNLHAARSPLHELPGLALAGLVGALLWPFDPRLAFVVFVAFSVHLAQDLVMGTALPFAPVDRTEVRMFVLSFRAKALIDLATLTLSGALWLWYLNVLG